MSKILKQKWVWLTLFTLFLCSGAYLIYSWSSQSSLTDHQLLKHQQRYQDLQDSIQVLNYNLRQDPEANIAQIQKDRIALFQTQINDLRSKISQLSKPHAQGNGSSSPLGQLGQLAQLLQLDNPFVRISLWTALAMIVLVVALAIIIKRRRLNSHKIRIPQTTHSTGPGQDTSSPQASSELEALLNQLQANQPIAQARARERVKPSSVLVQSPHDMPEVQEEIINHEVASKIKAPQNDQETDLPDLSNIPEDSALKSKIQPSQAPSGIPKAEEIFPSTLNRFDQEDKDKSDVLKLARRGYTSSEIARRLKISQDQVDFIIKLQREKG